jgi:type II secretory pathway pseudopilin PulG
MIIGKTMLNIKLMPFKQYSSQDQGFTMVEVLMATLAAFAFLLGTLQALALQAVVKVRAEREAQATFWIQKDIESVKAAAADVTDDSASSRCGATGYNSGFAFRLRQNLYGNLNGDGTPLNAANPDQYFTSIADTSTNPNIQVAPSRKLVNKDYRLVRIINPDPNNVNILKITYRVGLPRTDSIEKNYANLLPVTTDPTLYINTYTNLDQLQNNTPGNPSILAEQYVEVIPSAAITC